MPHVLLAVELRARMFRNSLRSGGGQLEFASALVLGAVLFGAAAWASVSAGFGASLFAGTDFFVPYLTGVLAIDLVVWQSLPFLAGSFGVPFDVSRLRQYPISTGELYATDLVFATLSPITVVGAMPLAALLVGTALSGAGPVALTAAALGLFGVLNLALSRFARRTASRLFATRTRREVANLLVLLAVLGVVGAFQLEVARLDAPGADAADDPERALAFIAGQVREVAGALAWTPPGVAARAAGGEGGAAGLLAITAGLAAAVFALDYRRMARDLDVRARGEAGGARPAPAAEPARGADGGPAGALELAEAAPRGEPLLPEAPGAVFAKELRYVARSPFALQTTLGTVFASVIFSIALAGDGDPRFEAYRLAGLYFYSFLVCSHLYINAFGLDGHGAKLYFMSPVRARDVIVGKNLAIGLVIAAQMAAITAAMRLVAGPFSPAAVGEAALIAGAVLPAMLGVGNYLSALRPHAIDASRVFNRNQSTTATLAMLGAAVLAGLAAALAPLAGWLTDSRAVEYAVLAAVFAASALVYSALLAASARALERRPDAFLATLLKR